MVSVEQLDADGNVILSERDKKLFKDLIDIREKVGNKDFAEESFETIKCKNKEELDAYISKIKKITGIEQDEDLDKIGIFFDISRNSTYKNKKGEEIYLEGEDGKVYEYSTHPERKQPIENFENVIIIIDNDQISRMTNANIIEQIINIFSKNKEK